jgi:phosphoribosylglycinamide formyltransferase-1
MQNEVSSQPMRIAILLSGGGTTMLNIQKEIDAGQLNAKIVKVISSRTNVKGVERAKNLGFNVEILRKKDFDSLDKFSDAIVSALDIASTELIVQAGWLCLWKIPPQYENKVMNIHPALLPSFGGKGMWGHNVHQAVLDAGCKISGCTVHFCTNEYDKGPIITQLSCPVEESDNAGKLAARVFDQECIAYPKAIKLFAQKKLKVEANKVIIKD